MLRGESSAQFGEEELRNLALAITTINSWNRLAIAFRAMPVSYQPQARRQAQVS